MDMKRSPVKSVYADTERHSIWQKRAAESGSTLSLQVFVFASRPSSMINVPHKISCPWLSKIKAWGAPEIHLALPDIIIFDLLLVSQILTVLSGHPEGAL